MARLWLVVAVDEPLQMDIEICDEILQLLIETVSAPRNISGSRKSIWHARM